MGLTALRAAHLLLGRASSACCPAPLVYVNAGTQLGASRSLRGLLSPALHPARRLPACCRWGALDAAQTPAGCSRASRRPARFDRNLIVIGAGSAGLVSAYIAAAVKAKVDAGREAPDGRRLPEYRLRALEGADPLGQAAAQHRAARGTSASRAIRAEVDFAE